MSWQGPWNIFQYLNITKSHTAIFKSGQLRSSWSLGSTFVIFKSLNWLFQELKQRLQKQSWESNNSSWQSGNFLFANHLAELDQSLNLLLLSYKCSKSTLENWAALWKSKKASSEGDYWNAGGCSPFPVQLAHLTT